MKNIKYLLIILIILHSCDIDLVDKTKVPQVSVNVLESKKNNVFIKEYVSNRPELFNEIWSEQLWILDSLGKIVKLDQYNIYFKTSLNIGVSKDSIGCSWCSNCGNKGEYIFSKISNEEKSKDYLYYYFFDLENNKCIGKVSFKQIDK